MTSAEQPLRPRYSSLPLPPYSYVPGHAPHPVSDPAGHMYGLPHATPPPLEPARWQQSETYRYGVDLFNHGFYWEAHEAWESLWHAADRQGAVATWLKALIKLAAACVKIREGNAAGAVRHARRSLELLSEVRRALPAGDSHFCGVLLDAVENAATEIAREAESGMIDPAPSRLLGQWIRLPI